MILPNSRYRNSLVVLLDVGDEIRKTIVPSPQADWTFQYTIHVVTAGERIEHIANKYYNDDTQWWNIADANPEILNWSTLAGGTVLRIPRV